MKKILFILTFFVPLIISAQDVIINMDHVDADLFNGQLPTYYLDTSSLTQAKSGQISLNGLTIFGDKINADYTEAGNAVNETRYYDFLVDVQDDPAANAEISAGYFRANKTAGSNGVYIINGLEGAVGSSYADEAGTFRGVYGRTYTSAGATATMRTAIGGEFSVRAGYNGGTDCVAESGTAFTGARIWMAPYFTSGSLSNINNFHGFWLYNEHTSNTVTNAIFVDDAGGTGGWTNGINFNGATIETAEIVLSNNETIDNLTDGEIHINASFEPTTTRSHDLGEPNYYWHGTYTDDLYVSDSATIDTAVVIGRFNVDYLKTANTTVVTIDSNGDADSLETVDITTITHDTLKADFIDVTNDLDVGDTIEFDNGLQIYNTHADTAYIEETVCKIEGDLVVTGNITNTPTRGGSYISTAGTQTIGTGGTFEKLYEGAMAYTACCLHDFTESNGRLTYTGTLTIHATINCNISVESGEAAQIVQFRLAKNGTTIAGTNMTREFTAQNKDSCIGLNWLSEMATNDYIEVFGTSDTNGDTFDINNLTLSVVKN